MLVLFLVACVAFVHGVIGYPSNSENHENSVQSSEKNYKCDFEKGLCSFLRNSPYNWETWKLFQGKKISTDIGPSVDHTFGTANGTYLLVNMTRVKPEKVTLQTIVLEGNYCIRFFYYMYGADTDDLKVVVHSIYNSSDITEYFSHRKTQGDRWKEALISISPTSTMRLRGYRVTFTALQKTAYRLGGAVALDDIELMPGLCPSRKENAMELCTFDAHDCGYTTNEKSSEKWEHKSRLNSSSPISAVPEEDHTLGTSYGGFWFSFKENGDMGTQTSFLRSPIYKAPKTSMNCLQFFFYIAEDSGYWLNWYRSTKEIYVRAIINYPYSKMKNPTWLITKVTNTTISEWRYAEANVDITEDYQFQFTAFIESSKEVVVAIDDVKLIPGRCPETGFCDFEEDICSWKYGEGQYKWDRICSSSKGIQKIGPNFDNTLGTNNGYYIVFSSKKTSENSEATFESEIFPPDEDEFCLTFYYQMSGKNLGTLKVLKREGSGGSSTLWVLQGDQKKTWKKGRAIIQPTVEEYQIIFQGITGNGTNDFMAIDDIRIRKGELCKITPPKAEPLEDDLNTTYEPFNYTYDFKTSSEPSNYTYDFNTTYEPINSTYYRTSSTPAPRTTLKKHASCQNDRDCLNGGLCRKLGRGESFCDCPPLFVGEWCEMELCERMHSKCQAMGAICKIAGLNAVCECLPGTIYRRKSGLCEDICDPWKCDHGKCQVIGRNYRCICDEGYTGSKCDQQAKQKQNVFAVWFIVLAVISMSTFVLLIGTLCFICHFKRSLGK